VNDQPSPNAKGSSVTFERPQPSNLPFAQTRAASSCGDAVSRGPSSSVRTRKVSITCERRRPSSRILLIVSRSTSSSARAAGASAETASATSAIHGARRDFRAFIVTRLLLTRLLLEGSGGSGKAPWASRGAEETRG
jgi:hypothetical protein